MGALRASWSDYGIGKDFIENVRNKVTEGTSALFLLVGQVTSDRVEEAFKSAPQFEVIASNLSQEQEEKLKDAFSHETRARRRGGFLFPSFCRFDLLVFRFRCQLLLARESADVDHVSGLECPY